MAASSKSINPFLVGIIGFVTGLGVSKFFSKKDSSVHGLEGRRQQKYHYRLDEYYGASGEIIGIYPTLKEAKGNAECRKAVKYSPQTQYGNEKYSQITVFLGNWNGYDDVDIIETLYFV
jgi:hypothetical protein